MYLCLKWQGYFQSKNFKREEDCNLSRCTRNVPSRHGCPLMQMIIIFSSKFVCTNYFCLSSKPFNYSMLTQTMSIQSSKAIQEFSVNILQTAFRDNYYIHFHTKIRVRKLNIYILFSIYLNFSLKCITVWEILNGN
jgi:hypothetical protein